MNELSTTLSSNSMHRSLRVALQVALETQHNAFLKLNASLPKGRSAGRVGKLSTTLSSNSMHRSLRVALQVALENSAQRFPMGRVVGSSY